MQKLYEDKERIIRTIYERWGKVVRSPVTHRDYDYYDLHENDVVHNPIVGTTTVKHMRELRRMGVLLFRHCWRIPTEERVDERGRKSLVPTARYLAYQANGFRLNTVFNY